MRRLTAAIALVLVALLTTSVWASCMAEIGMTAAAQMACCEHGHDTCPMHGTPESCCQGESHRHQQLTAATHELAPPVVNRPALVAAVVLPALATPVVRVARLTSTRDVLKRPAPPPYLLGSAFLV